MADPTDEEDIPALEADEESLAQAETQGPLIVKEAEGRWAREAMDDALALGWEEEEVAFSGSIDARSTLVPQATPPSAPRRRGRPARPWAMALAGAAVLALSAGATFAFGAVVVLGWSLGGNSASQATIVPSAPAQVPVAPAVAQPEPAAVEPARVEPVVAEPAPAPEVVAATPSGTAPAPKPRAKTSTAAAPPPAAAAAEPAPVADAPRPPPAPAPAASEPEDEKRGLFRKKKDR